MKKNTILFYVFLALSVIFTAMAKFFDVQAIGPDNTSVGFAALNGAVASKIGVNMTWYKITEYVGYAALLVCGVFALVGLIQLIKRKSLKKVDGEIYAVAGLYVVVLMVYVLFEKVVINYRPVIMEGETTPEASFPSSHTMLAIVVLGSAIMLIKKYFANKQSLGLVLIFAACLMIAVMVIGRLVSGVHWFTDILAGVFISCMLLSAFGMVLDKLKKEN